MRTITTICQLLLATLTCFDAHSQSESTMMDKFISLHFKSSSEDDLKAKPSVEEIASNARTELVRIYVKYQQDSAISSNTQNSIETPPNKLTDLFLVYEYIYRFKYEKGDNIAETLPAIALKNGDNLMSVNTGTFTADNGKVKGKKVKKKYVFEKTGNRKVALEFDEEGLVPAYYQVIISVMSRDFKNLTPTFSDGELYSRKLQISLPEFLIYNYPESSEDFTLESSSKSKFKVLKFNRLASDADEGVKDLELDSKIQVWKVNTSGKVNIEFLQFHPGFKDDIGISPQDIIN